MAVIFFALRILLYIPTGFFTLRLFLYNSQSGGKALYGLKLAIFLIFLIFNVIGLGFITDQGCSLMHTQIPKLNSSGEIYSKDAQ